MKKPHNPKIQAALSEFIAETGISQAAFARQIGMSPGLISAYIGGTYPGNVEGVEAKVSDAILSASRQKENPAIVFPTTIISQIDAAVSLIREECQVGAIYGEAGIGKTVGILDYVSRNPTAISVSLSQWNRSDKALEGLLMGSMDSRSWKGNTPRAEFLAARLRKSGRPILIDNAHRLIASSRRWVFDFWDETRTPIILFGNPEFVEPIRENDQFFRRLGLCREIRFDSASKPNGTRDAADAFLDLHAPDIADAIRPDSRRVAAAKGHLGTLSYCVGLTKRFWATGKFPTPLSAFHSAHASLLTEAAL